MLSAVMIAPGRIARAEQGNGKRKQQAKPLLAA
jgi:hypothetical protein